MPGRRCAVFSCTNSRIVTKAKGQNIIYHNFPRDESVKKEWVRCCNRASGWNPNTSQICSIHFTEDDYKRDLSNELLGLPIRRVLKKSVVPTLNLSNPDDVKLECKTEIIELEVDNNFELV